MIEAWVSAYETTNQNALSAEWFISPLEYSWPDGKNLFNKIFSGPATPSSKLDGIVAPEIFKSSMQIDFRAKMMVFAFMRQDISKSFGFEIENGLMHLYRLDFMSCLSQWIYVVEGYCRKLFSVQSLQNVRPSLWQLPISGDVGLDRLIAKLASSLESYLNGVMFRSTSNFHIEALNRHLLLHGNVANKDFFNQKSCLILMFILDALVVIEMAKNKAFPAVFDERDDEAERIERRKFIYMKQMAIALQDESLLKMEILKEHL
jgi:hypothetical protein